MGAIEWMLVLFLAGSGLLLVAVLVQWLQLRQLLKREERDEGVDRKPGWPS